MVGASVLVRLGRIVLRGYCGVDFLLLVGWRMIAAIGFALILIIGGSV